MDGTVTAPRDSASFAVWVAPHLPVMAALAARLAPGADRDDVVQDALLRAWRRRSTYDAGRGTARTWLLAVTADQARRTRGRARPTLPAVSDGPATGRDLDAYVDLERAVAALPRRQREVVECVYLVGLTVAETAAVLGIAAGTVKSTLSDARSRLRAQLEVTG